MTVSPWITTPRCFRVLQVFSTMSNGSDCETWELGTHRQSQSHNTTRESMPSQYNRKKLMRIFPTRMSNVTAWRHSLANDPEGGGLRENSPGIAASPISLLPMVALEKSGRSLTAGKILFTGTQTCSLYLVLWLCAASFSQDVVEGGFGSNAPRSKVASSGLTLMEKHSNHAPASRMWGNVRHQPHSGGHTSCEGGVPLDGGHRNDWGASEFLWREPHFGEFCSVGCTLLQVSFESSNNNWK